MFGIKHRKEREIKMTTDKKYTAEEIEIKPSKTCDMCDWKTNYTCCDCERIQGGSGLHYNDYDYFVRLTNGKKDYINRYNDH